MGTDASTSGETSESANGATTDAGGATEEPKYLSRTDLDVWSSNFARKINGEMAALRRSIEGRKSEPKTETQGAGADAAPAPVTLDDLRAYRELGRLEASLGEEMIAALGEEYAEATPKEQAKILRLLSAAAKARDAQTAGGDSRSDETSEARGETPRKPRQTTRAAPAPKRDSVPRPTTRREYLAMKPDDRAALRKSDPDFDSSVLPY